MVSSALVSTVLMGVLLVVAFVAVARLGRKVQHDELTGDADDRYDAMVIRGRAVANHPATWTIAFIGLALIAGLVAVLAVGGFGMAEEAIPGLFGAVVAIMGLLIAGFLFLGPYFAVRQRGLGNAHGVAAGVGVVGLGFLLLVSAQLVFDLIG